MPSKQSYLTKKFRGRYVERLIEFLCGLDKNWSWKTTYYIHSFRQDDSTAYCKMYCQENGKLLLVKLDMIERDVSENVTGVRFREDKKSWGCLVSRNALRPHFDLLITFFA